MLSERYPDEPELQICHRLDRETSGCLVVARDRAAAGHVKDAFAAKGSARVTKEYLAIVHGQPPWDTDHVIDLNHHRRQQMRYAVIARQLDPLGILSVR